MTSEPTPFDNDQTAEIERLRFALQAANIGTWDYNLPTKQVQWSAICKELFGLPANADVTAAILLEQVHPDDRERVRQANVQVLGSTSDSEHNIRFRTLNPQGTLRWVEVKGKVLWDGQGQIVRFSGIVQEVTQQVLAQNQIVVSETQLRRILENTPDAITRWNKDCQLLLANSAYSLKTGADIAWLLGKTNLEMGQPADIAQAYMDSLRKVLSSGQPQEHYNSFPTPRGDVFFHSRLVPEFNADGTVESVLAIAHDVTDLKQSEARFRSIIQQTPAPTMVLRGDNYVVDQINESMLALIGKDREAIGQPLLALMPELSGEFAWQQNQRVYQEGIHFDGEEIFVRHATGGVIQGHYYNLAYRPLREEGRITGVIQVVTEMTQQVLARQKLEESEATLRNAIELAKLGTWKMDVATGQMTYSERLQNWLGINEAVLGRVASPRVHPKDHDRVSLAIEKALEKGGSGHYEEIYTITNALTGQEHIIHTSGQTVFDAAGVAVSLSGTAQDITLQQQLQLSLAQQVQQRTEELAAKNEELMAANKEVVATNQSFITANTQLLGLNSDLRRSNQNLEQFAYIASHDLQEPLRKIQQFSDILITQYRDQLSDGIDYLQRMQLAARRMATLIRDLLAYSRIATQQETVSTVSLTKVVNTVLADLELRIEETEAILEVVPLPTVTGDSSQLEQLFYNLLANALKFSRRDESGKLIPPLIQVKVNLVRARDLPLSVKPGRAVEDYHRIDVVDNGIGFDEKYLDRIFQVFQRLHGKNAFAGTGIGLAICEKVAANHGGAITASSQPGEGATFSVYLPA